MVGNKKGQFKFFLEKDVAKLCGITVSIFKEFTKESFLSIFQNFVDFHGFHWKY